MAKSGAGFLGGGRESPLHQLGSLGERCKLLSVLSGVRGGAPENLDFGAIFDLRNHVRTIS